MFTCSFRRVASTLCRKLCRRGNRPQPIGLTHCSGGAVSFGRKRVLITLCAVRSRRRNSGVIFRKTREHYVDATPPSRFQSKKAARAPLLLLATRRRGHDCFGKKLR